MADESIRVNIKPASAGGKRLAESPISSFSADRFTQRNTGAPAAFAAPGTGARSEINAQRELVSSQRALTQEIKQLRAALKATLPGTAERAALKGRVDQLLQQQARNLTPLAFATSAAGRETGAKDEAAAAPMPGAAQRGLGISAQNLAVAGQSLFKVAREIAMGNPMGALSHAASGVSTIAGGRFAGGGSAISGGGAAAEGAAADAEATGLGLGPTLGIAAGATALAVGGYEAYKHPDIAKAVIGAPGAFYDAWHYSREEAERQTQAYQRAREFGEAGGPLSSFTRGSRFSALGMDPTQALDVTGSMRETAGASNVSDAQAFRATKLGTAIGLSNQDISAIGGAAGKLGIDPERMIDIVAKGVERGGALGLQGEVGRATIAYLQSQSRLGAVNESKAAETVTGMAALLGASGIAAFKGEGAVTTGVAGITAANQPDDLLGVQSVGQSYTMLGQAKLLQSINTDPRFKRMSMLDRVGMADRILTQGLTGPNASLYLRNTVAPEIRQAQSQGLYGLESLEKAYNWPVGDASDKLLTGSMLTAAESGDVTQYLKLKSQLEANGPKNIPDASKAMAEHAAARSATGASALGTFAGIERTEAAMVRTMAISPSTDKLLGSALTKVADALPGSSSSALTPGAPGTSSPWGAAYGGGPAGTFYGAPPLFAGGAPATAGAGAGDTATDSTARAVGLSIVSAIEILVAAVRGIPLPPATPAPAPGSIRRAISRAGTGPTAPTASTPKSPHS